MPGLRARARLWAARAVGDRVEHVPHADVGLFGTTVGFGADPVSPAFGARVLAAGDGGHGDYFAPGSVPLADLTRIVLGRILVKPGLRDRTQAAVFAYESGLVRPSGYRGRGEVRHGAVLHGAVRYCTARRGAVPGARARLPQYPGST